MNISLNNVKDTSVLGGLQPSEDIVANFANVSANEFRTIYYALREYSDKLEKSSREAREADGRSAVAKHEELMFTYETLSRVNGVLFEMLENYRAETRDQVRKWADCL